MEKRKSLDTTLSAAPSEDLLRELACRGGHPGAVAEAVLLCYSKSADYNQGMGHEDMHRVDRSAYFPFGLTSYAQMLHTKTLRLVSLCRRGGEANFEGAVDTLLDVINYAGFAIDGLSRKEADRG